MNYARVSFSQQSMDVPGNNNGRYFLMQTNIFLKIILKFVVKNLSFLGIPDMFPPYWDIV